MRTSVVALALWLAASGAAFAQGLPAAAPESVELLAGRTIAVLDDDPDVRDGMRALLGAWGCTVFTAATPAGLVKACTAPPDLIVADYHLGSGGKGTRAIERLRAAFGPVPAVLLTSDRSITPAEALQVLYKPVNPPQLRAMMSWLLNPPTA